jgi:hypothetical protein
MGAPNPPVVLTAVAPTSTVVVELDVREAEWVTMQLDNRDASQTFNGTIERRQSPQAEWAPSTLSDFSGVGPLSSVVADLDVSGTGFMRLVGTMSGAGGDVATCTRVGARKP